MRDDNVGNHGSARSQIHVTPDTDDEQDLECWAYTQATEQLYTHVQELFTTPIGAYRSYSELAR